MAPEILARKLEHLATYLRDLRPFKNCSKKFYLDNHYEIDRLLELIITVAIDIMFHLVAEKDEQAPSTYASAFLRAGELKLLPKSLSRSWAKAAGFRNVLAHGYERINPEIVNKSIPQVLRDGARLVRVLKKRTR